MLKLIDKIIPSEVKLLAKWRKQIQPIWHETFKVTYKGTAKWLQGVIDNPNKKLYFVVKGEKYIGHVGYHIIDGEFYIDNIVRGEGESDGSMTKAIQELIKDQKEVFLLVYPDLKKAIDFYTKIGFKHHSMVGKYLKMVKSLS